MFMQQGQRLREWSVVVVMIDFMGSYWQYAEKVRQPALFIWFVRVVSFVWLNETNQMNRASRAQRSFPAAC